jgi:hypothetical protein
MSDQHAGAAAAQAGSGVVESVALKDWLTGRWPSAVSAGHGCICPATWRGSKRGFSVPVSGETIPV